VPALADCLTLVRPEHFRESEGAEPSSVESGSGHMARLLAPSLCSCPSVLGCHTASLGCRRSMTAIPSSKTFVEVKAQSECEAQRVAAGPDVGAEDQRLRQTESAAGTESHIVVRVAPEGSAFRRVSLA
jgi:hypothetical protein